MSAPPSGGTDGLSAPFDAPGALEVSSARLRRSSQCQRRSIAARTLLGTGRLEIASARLRPVLAMTAVDVSPLGLSWSPGGLEIASVRLRPVLAMTAVDVSPLALFWAPAGPFVPLSS